MITDNVAQQLLGNAGLPRDPSSTSLASSNRQLEIFSCSKALASVHVDEYTTTMDNAQYHVVRMTTTPFSGWLEEHMGRKGWLQSDLHRASGIPKQNISAWLNGRNRPTPEQVKVLVEALGADLLSAYRALGWYDEPTADSDAQADFIAEFRRRELNDTEIKQLTGMLDMFFPKDRHEGK